MVITTFHISAANKADGHQATLKESVIEKQRIRVELDNILNDPELQAQITWGQWLKEQLDSFEPPNLNLPSFWSQALLWLFIGWCSLALIAIIGHIGWSFWTTMRMSEPNSFNEGFLSQDPVEAFSYEQLRSKAKDLADKGLFVDAAKSLLNALLARLNQVGFIRYHQSKTNGDYVREYPRSQSSVLELKDFMSTFDNSIYGGRDINENTYQHLWRLLEAIIDNAPNIPSK